MGKNTSFNMMDLLNKSGFSVSDEAKKDNLNREREAENRNKDKYKNYQGGGKNNNNRNSNQGYQSPKWDESKYVGAPYNFVPFNEKVYALNEADIIPHDTYTADNYSGELIYTITAHTPICVGGLTSGSKDNEIQDFYKTADGKYAIPGSTVRGLIRNNVQVLGCTNFGNDIDDYALMYRSVGTPKSDPNKSVYENTLGNATIPMGAGSISILKNVKAGYIENRNGKYYILHTKPDAISKEFAEMNYYVISERKIINDHLKNCSDDSFKYLFDNNLTQNDPNVQFRKEEIKGRIHWKGRVNKSYKPGFTEVSYELKGIRNVTAVGAPGKYKLSGYLVGTGYMNEKKALYIIPEVDEANSFVIPEADVKAFNIDFEKKKNNQQIKENKKFYSLPEERKRKIVFYIQLGGRLYFGFTPRLRLFYDHTIEEGLPKEQLKNDTLDFAKSLFGFTEGTGYKSKLSFSDALINGDSNGNEEVALILGEPKASSYNDYLLTKNGLPVSYSCDDFKLRGIKQYWLRNNVVSKEFDSSKSKIYSHFRPLPAGVIFDGKVRFKNLTKDELGLLLWSIRLEKNSHMNIGKAKAYGYGNITISVNNLSIFDFEKAYSLDGLCLDPWKDEVDKEFFIDEYKKKLAEFLHVDDIMKNSAIGTFFAMKDDTRKPAADKIRYMDIDQKEYQNRRPLPIAMEVVELK